MKKAIWGIVIPSGNGKTDEARDAQGVTTLTGAALEAVVGGLNPQPLPPRVERE